MIEELFLPPRLQREALKQAAIDPSTGKIDVSILATGISGAARKRRAEIAQSLKKILQELKAPTIKKNKLHEQYRETQDSVSIMLYSIQLIY